MPHFRRESLKWWTNLCGFWTGADLVNQFRHDIAFSGHFLLEFGHFFSDSGHFFTESGQGAVCEN